MTTIGETVVHHQMLAAVIDQGEVLCPYCLAKGERSPATEHWEYTPCRRPIQDATLELSPVLIGSRRLLLHIDNSCGSEAVWESSEGDRLGCDSYHEFAIPDGVELEWDG